MGFWRYILRGKWRGKPFAWQSAAVFAAIILCLAGFSIHAAQINLRNGTALSGRILYRDADFIRIDTGTGQLVVRRELVDSIEEDRISAAYVISQLQDAVNSGREALEQDRLDRATRLFELALLQLNNYMEEERGDPPSELIDLRNNIYELRRQTLSQDPASLEAERLFRQAQDQLDHLEYKAAFENLRRAARLAPDRTDIHFQLAEVAVRHMQDEETAIEAFRTVLELKPEIYYGEAAQPLLDLARRRGIGLLDERRAREALPLFEELMALESEDEGIVVPLEEYLARKEQQEEQTDTEKLMQVYRYADANDLVDLALAAATEMEILNPDDSQIRRMARESEFLSAYLHAVEQGDLEQATRLRSEADPSLLNSSRIAERLDEISRQYKNQIQAQLLFDQASEAFENDDLPLAAQQLDELFEKYPNTPVIEDAEHLRAQVKAELPIYEGLNEARELMKNRLFEEAEASLQELLEIDNIENSRFHGDILAQLDAIQQEREAFELWDQAGELLKNDQLDQARAVLEEISDQYPDTIAGRQASDWLDRYRTRLVDTIELQQRIDQGLLAGLDPFADNANGLDPLRRDTVTAGYRMALAFDDMRFRELRPRWMYIGVPLLIGLILLAVILLKSVKKGLGRWPDPATEDIPDKFKLRGLRKSDQLYQRCRMCGLPIPAESKQCKHCGASSELTQVEADRLSSEQRHADFDPWSIRTNPTGENNYDEYFAQAEKMAKMGDHHLAIEACRKALHEDPRRIDGYELLADQYEQINQPRKAALCYREIMLLNPNTPTIQLKLEARSERLSTKPLNIQRLISILGGLTAWLVFWLIFGLIPIQFSLEFRIANAIGMSLACGLIFGAWVHFQNKHYADVEPSTHEEADVEHPIPFQTLRLREQERQSRVLAQKIAQQTGIKAPQLGLWRFGVALGLSLLFLLGLIGLAWTNRSPLVLLAWPAGVALLYYLLVIHPRALTAYILLRHLYEQTYSTWTDPHRPFKPKGVKRSVHGEFLIRQVEEFPVYWAFNPAPYRRNHQGVLNSLQQTLNRHWSCHRYYPNMEIIRSKYEIPMPIGFNILQWVCVGFVALSLIGAAGHQLYQIRHGRLYAEAIDRGFDQLVQGKYSSAIAALTGARLLEKERVTPYIYLGHAYAAMDQHDKALEAYEQAYQLAPNFAVVLNDYANYLQRSARIERALELYEKALRDQPDNADILNNMAAACYKLERYDEAVKHLNRSIELDPNHQRAYTTAGLCYEALGDLERARAYYRQAIKRSPDNPYTEVARRRIESNLAALTFSLEEETPQPSGLEPDQESVAQSQST